MCLQNFSTSPYPTKACLHPPPPTHTLSLLSLEATKAPVFVLQALLQPFMS